MKYLAHRKPDGSDRPISIYDVIRGRKSDNPEEWAEGKEYYSLWYHTPMKAVVKGKSPHFAFKSGHATGHDKGGESIEHSLSKQIISELKVLKVAVYGKSYVIPIKQGNVEHPERFRDRGYRIDVVLEAEPCIYTREFGSELIGIEVKKTSRVKSVKKHAVRNLEVQMSVLEITLNPVIKLDENADVELLYKRLTGYWGNERKAFCLHKPNYQEWLKEQKEKEAVLHEQKQPPTIVDPKPEKPVPVKVTVKETVPNSVLESIKEDEMETNEEQKDWLAHLIIAVVVTGFIVTIIYYYTR